MRRLGRFYFGWGEPDPEDIEQPTMIVARNQDQVRLIRRNAMVRSDRRVRIIAPSIHQIYGGPPPCIVIVLAGVDLDMMIEGKALGGILRSRQAPWGPLSVWVDASRL